MFVSRRQRDCNLTELARAISLTAVRLHQPTVAAVVEYLGLPDIGDEVSPGTVGRDRPCPGQVVLLRLRQDDRVQYKDGGLGARLAAETPERAAHRTAATASGPSGLAWPIFDSGIVGSHQG